MMSAPKTISGRAARTPSQKAMASSRRCRRFIRFRIMSSPACSDRCRCGISRGSPAIASTSRGSASTESIEESRSRGRSGTAARIAATRSPSRPPPSRSAPQLVRSTPVSTTSLNPRSTSRAICSITVAVGTLREFPRP